MQHYDETKEGRIEDYFCITSTTLAKGQTVIAAGGYRREIKLFWYENKTMYCVIRSEGDVYSLAFAPSHPRLLACTYSTLYRYTQVVPMKVIYCYMILNFQPMYLKAKTCGTCIFSRALIIPNHGGGGDYCSVDELIIMSGN